MSHDLIQYTSGQDIHVWGRNATVGTSLEDLYQADQAMDHAIQLGVGVALDITSSSTADDVGSTGATQIRITGLDANWLFQSEDVSLDGRTIVTTTKQWRDVFGMDVIAHGTGNANAGDIYAVATGTGGSYTNGVPGTVTSLVAKMLVGWNICMNGRWTVPAGSDNYRLKLLQASSYTQAAVLHLCIQEPWGTDKTTHLIAPIGIGSSGNFFADMSAWALVLEPKQTLRLRVIGASSSAVVQASFVLRRG
jgi:hypothetical protein